MTQAIPMADGAAAEVRPPARKVDPQWLADVVTRHLGLVKRIAHHLVARLPVGVQVDDLIQSGVIGLMEAAQKFDASKGASFETYVGIRIRGAMFDEMRKGDWSPRSVYRNWRKIEQATQAIEARTGSDASHGDVARELDIDLNGYYRIVRDANASRLCSFNSIAARDDTVLDSVAESAPGPAEGRQREEFLKQFAREVVDLPKRERQVLALYYTKNLNLKEIGQVMGVSESRVSQIHGQAARRLRTRLSSWS